MGDEGVDDAEPFGPGEEIDTLVNVLVHLVAMRGVRSVRRASGCRGGGGRDACRRGRADCAGATMVGWSGGGRMMGACKIIGNYIIH